MNHVKAHSFHQPWVVPNLKICLTLVFFLLGGFSQLSHSGPYEQNLLTNSDAETGDLSGWTLTMNGGHGWGVRNWDGSKAFATSYQWNKKSQLIDLLAKGFTVQELDLAPTIQVSEKFTRFYCPDEYMLSVELLDENFDVVSTYQTGNRKTEGVCEWTEIDKVNVERHIFSDYGEGVRYIRWTDGGKDTEFWGGQYGVHMDDARLIVYSPKEEARNYLSISDAIKLQSTNGEILSCESGGIVANEVNHQLGCEFHIELQSNGVIFHTHRGYVFTNGQQLGYTSSKASASVYQVLMTANGTFKIADSNLTSNWTIQPNLHDILVTPFNDYSRVDEFTILLNKSTTSLQLSALSNSYASNITQECLIAEATLLWDLTGGFFLAIGLGPYINDGTVATGFVGIIRQNSTLSAAFDALQAAIVDNGAVSASLAFGFIHLLYEEGMLWTALQYAGKQIGWWGAAYVLKTVIEWGLAPEYAAAELLTSATIWGGRTVLAAVDVAEKCQ